MTGFTTPDVFYFGNLAGESYYDVSTGHYVVNSLDQSATRRHWGETATIANLYDHNRDGTVGSLDNDVIDANVFAQLIQLVVA